jgi:hypothetical protein
MVEYDARTTTIASQSPFRVRQGGPYGSASPAKPIAVVEFEFLSAFIRVIRGQKSSGD